MSLMYRGHVTSAMIYMAVKFFTVLVDVPLQVEQKPEDQTGFPA